MLAISSEALPDAEPLDFFDACAGRGILGLEVSAGTRCADAPESLPLLRVLRGADPVEIVAYRVMDPEIAHGAAGARLSAHLDAPVVCPPLPGGAAPLARAAGEYSGSGGTLLVSCEAEIGAVRSLAARLDAVDEPSLGVALEIRPGVHALGGIAGILDVAGDRLRLVRLHGGGAEGGSQTGQGIGALMAALAIRRYAHPLVLTPSRADYRRIWATWLGRSGGWGCGGSTPLTSLGGGRTSDPQHYPSHRHRSSPIPAATNG